MKKLSLVAALSAIIVSACAPASQVSTEIPERSAAWETAFNAGDVEALMALYAEDARMMAPNAAPGQGHDAVRAVFSGMIDAGLRGELESVEAVAAGDIAYHVGTYSILAANEVVDRGKFIEIWRKVGGEWKIAADIFNSDLPLAPAAPAGPTLVITHEVKDPAHWLAAWAGPDGRAATFKEHGATGVRVFQSPDDPKRVGLLVDVADMDAFMTWAQSEDAAKAKAADGVIDETMRVLSEVE